MKPLNEKEPLSPRDPSNMNDPRNFKAKDPQMLNKMNDPETGLKARQTAQNDAIATRMAKDTASSFGKSPPKPIPYMPPYKRINQQSISGPVTKANEENTMSLIHDKKTMSVADAVSKIMEAEKMAKKDHDQDGKIESGKDEYLGSRIRAAKMSGKLKEELKGNQHKIDANKNGKVDAHDFKLLRGKKTMKEEEQIDEAFPTVADGEKSLRAKEGKTSSGTLTKTKTGLVHTRDYEDDSDDTPAKKGRPTGGGAGKSTKKKKLSEMIAAYKEKGIDSLYEEPDNETFTKELKDQKAKFDGKKKGGDVAKPSVQAVKVEQYEEDDGPLSEEQLDELSKSTVKSYVMKKMEKPTTTKKDVKGMTNAYNRLKGYKPTSEEVELEERTLTADEKSNKEDYVKGMKKSVSGFKARYGNDAKSVMYATATKMAKKD
jgi:hypothetical protein